MGTRRRSRTIEVQVDTHVDVDLDEILDEIDTEDLEAELAKRRNKGVRVPLVGPIGGPEISFTLLSWDAESLVEAVRANDAYRTLDLLKERLK